MMRRLLAVAIVIDTTACAGLLSLDPGTLRESAEAGADAAAATDAGARRCASALGDGIYCDDFDEPGRTDPASREARADNGTTALTLVDSPSRSAPRSLRATYETSGIPRDFLTLDRTLSGSFHLLMSVRVARGASPGAAFIVGELEEVAGRSGVTYAIVLTPRQEAVEVKLREASTTLITHSKTFPYDEWHDVAMRFNERNAYLELDGESVVEGVAVVEGDYYVNFGIQAAAPVTVFLDDVEIGPTP